METEFICWLRERVAPHSRLQLGIGDDAAILSWPDAAGLVVTTDMLMDGTHFELEKCGPRLAGRKSLAVNLSDLAAMAARPVAITVSLALPRHRGKELAIEICEGFLPLAHQFGVALAGGDTNSWQGPLAISITAFGEVDPIKAWRRSGARAGDELLVTGEFGGSLAASHMTFQPRVAEAIEISEHYRVNAAIDVSDGLSLDVSRIARESGCGVLLDLDSIPISNDARRLAGDGANVSALDHALGDGEDFELALAVAPAEAARILSDQPVDVPVTRIGRFIDEPGLWVADVQGKRPLAPRGFEH